MARRHAARGSARGGERIPSSRATSARIAVALAAVVAATTVAGYPAWSADRFAEFAAAVGGIAVAILIYALARPSTTAVGWTLGLLAGAYAFALWARDDDALVDARAPFFAGGLLVVAELAYWSIELRVAKREDRGLMLRRLSALAGLAVVSIALGTFVIAATAVSVGSGLFWDLLGVVAAVATLGILARLAWRGATRPDSGARERSA